MISKCGIARGNQDLGMEMFSVEPGELNLSSLLSPVIGLGESWLYK
jgi:hypothetical protein